MKTIFQRNLRRVSNTDSKVTSDDNGGGSVIDVDREYGGTEVELVCGGYKHELYFDAQGNRIYAKIEYGRRDIGSAVPGSDFTMR